jgi:hypothetical protein
MTTLLKRRMAFALSMGIVTTGIISFSVLSINIGFSSAFPLKWLRAWILAYAIVIPIILLIGPRVQACVDRLIR